jgi:adenylate kinase
MDTYRIGTLLELARHLAFRVIEGTGRKVRICVQAPMGEGIFSGLPLSLNGVRKLLEMMDWGSQGAELQQKKFIRFGAVGSEWVDADDEVFVVLAPQSIVGNSIVPLLQDMVEAANGRPVILINGRMGDVQSSAGVMSYRGRADRLDFVDEFRECFHFSLVVPPGRTFFPILGAVCRPFLDCPYALYRRLELCTEENRVFANSVERAAAAKSGDLVEKYEPVGCYGDMPTAKEQKLAYREAAKADLAAGRVVRA